MAKIKLTDLEYIVLEGGGARGAAYLGAIRALEDKIDELIGTDSIQVQDVGYRKPALMDYYRGTEENPVKPAVIKGIAGSSAGAITSFALSLGFNSHEIETILKYPFDKFLKEKDVGRYRMVNKDGLPAIGDDKSVKGKGTHHNDLAQHKLYLYQFDKDDTPVGPNIGKLALRNIGLTLALKVLKDGIVSNIDKIFNNNLGSLRDLLSHFKFWRGFQRLFERLRRFNNSAGGGFVVQKAFDAILFKLLLPRLKAPINIDVDAIGNLMFDTGLFSGFKVREFYMDMLIFAISKKTHFSRSIIQKVDGMTFEEAVQVLHIQLPKVLPDHLKLIYASPKELSFEDLRSEAAGFEIGERKKAKFSKTSPELHLLSLLNFYSLNYITGVNVGLCSSNYSTGFPSLFGCEWTPHMLVAEAVAASMAIPPALKPVYNESNVVKPKEEVVNVKIDGSLYNFVKADGSFNQADYFLYEYVVKKGLQQLLLKPNGTGDYIDLNNAIDISTFLPKLRDIVVGAYEKDEETLEITGLGKPSTFISTKVEVNGKLYEIDYALYQFFYNAAYKGMFMDGGYRMNIPYNFFRMRNNNINTVLAIKLDEQFPPDLMDKVYRVIAPQIEKLDDFAFDDDDETVADAASVAETGKVLADHLRSRAAKLAVEKETRRIFELYMDQQEKSIVEPASGDKKVQDAWKAAKKQFKNDKKAIKSLAESVIKEYRKTRLSKPWAVRHSILDTVFDGYGYGSERGQVKQISDHNQIIPLYDYGVTVYDFDMSKVQPMVTLGQIAAVNQINDFFK